LADLLIQQSPYSIWPFAVEQQFRRRQVTERLIACAHGKIERRNFASGGQRSGAALLSWANTASGASAYF